MQNPVNDRGWSWLCLATGLLWMPVCAWAQAQGPAESVASTPWQWVQGRRDQVSRNVAELGRWVDDWLAGDTVGEAANESFLRVRLNQLQGTYSNYNSQLSVGGRLDLPRASERWKLIFESDVTELNTLNDNRLENIQSDVSIGGFRYQHETGNGWAFDHDLGLRARVPLDPFYRFRARYGRSLGTRWSLGLEQKLFYYHARGPGYDGTLSLSRVLAPDRYLRFSTQVNYRDERGVLEVAQAVTVHQSLGDRETLSHEAGVLGVNRPTTRFNAVYAQSRWRKAVYEDWLIMELSPQLLIAREQNWRPEPRLFVNFEVLFFDF